MMNSYTPFMVGCGSSMIATVCIQPIDTIKVRLQLMSQGKDKPSPVSIARNIVSKGGFFNLYDGLSAGLLRQLVYGTLRLGLFTSFEQHLERKAREQHTTLGFGGRAIAGIGAGAIAALIGNPTEVALVRMQSDGMLPSQQRRNYRSAFDALVRVAKEEGIFALWKGSAPTIIRAMSSNFGQLTFFSESKYQLRKHYSLSPEVTTALAAAIAGFAGAFISLPFDFVKTRLQNQSLALPSQNLPRYSGTVDCFAKVVRQEGALRFYRDFLPYFLRIAPHS
jgi:hypothetical protein